MYQTFAVAVKEADSVLGDVQTTLSEQQGEMAAFAQQTREVVALLLQKATNCPLCVFCNLIRTRYSVLYLVLLNS